MTELECAFSHAGCKVRLPKEEMERHLEESVQTHMMMMNRALQEQSGQRDERIGQLEQRLGEREGQFREQLETLEKGLREQLEELGGEIEALREEILKLKAEGQQHEGERNDKDKEKVGEAGDQSELQPKEAGVQDQIEPESEAADTESVRQGQELSSRLQNVETLLADELQRRETRIHEVETKVVHLEALVHRTSHQVEDVRGRTGVLPYLLSLHNFHRLKSSNSYWTSSSLYTHPRGYKLCIRVYPNGIGEAGASGTCVSVELCSLKGENDKHLKWPADCTITLQLLNQHRDQDHVTVSRRFKWHKPSTAYPWRIEWFTRQLVSHRDMAWNAKRQSHYLKNDSLVFKIAKIEVHE